MTHGSARRRAQLSGQQPRSSGTCPTLQLEAGGQAAPLDSDRWYLEVSDTGIGISSEALTYIFDEFRQVDDRLARTYGGTGLGLAITRKIVELLEGEISVESKPQEGSRFRIVWPRLVRQRTETFIPHVLTLCRFTGEGDEYAAPRPSELPLR